MQAKIDFDESINEVTYLNTVSQSDASNDKIYFKVIILLLCAKLEKFVKDSTNEYINLLLELDLTKDKLPEKFIIEIIKNEVSKIETMSVEKYVKNDRCVERSKIFSLIWDAKYKLRELQKKDFIVSISNNGTTAFEDTYKKIGFPNLIKCLEDYQQETNVAGLITYTAYSIPDYINKVIAIRHGIIHEDATPIITRNDINLFVEIIKDFAKQVDCILSKQINNLRIKSI